jgi:hypothetical protein
VLRGLLATRALPAPADVAFAALAGAALTALAAFLAGLTTFLALFFAAFTGFFAMVSSPKVLCGIKYRIYSSSSVSLERSLVGAYRPVRVFRAQRVSPLYCSYQNKPFLRAKKEGFQYQQRTIWDISYTFVDRSIQNVKGCFAK